MNLDIFSSSYQAESSNLCLQINCSILKFRVTLQKLKCRRAKNILIKINVTIKNILKKTNLLEITLKVLH